MYNDRVMQEQARLFFEQYPNRLTAIIKGMSEEEWNSSYAKYKKYATAKIAGRPYKQRRHIGSRIIRGPL